METKDDFASLLAALGRTPQVATSLSQPPPQQPMMWTPQYFQPVVAAPPPPTSNSMYVWIIAILLLAVLGLGAILWIKSSKMKEEVAEDSEEEEVVKAVFPAKDLNPPQEEPEEDLSIVQNLLNYARGEHYDFEEDVVTEEKNDYIDLSGLELPTEERYFGGNRKIVAEESKEVLDYAKKRESLFENNP